jgi:protein-L-isoaspartate(D-aspartate) O-methyltransferase
LDVIRLLPLALSLPLVAADPYAAKREAMVVDQLQSRDIDSQRVLQVMRTVPRHEFVPTGVRAMAYEDHPLPIGSGQTISQPYIVALMTQLLDVSRNHRVLEIGTGSGYQAAVVSVLAREVYSIEIVGSLAKDSARTLSRLGYSNVTVRHGNGYHGWPDRAPFDRIIVTAAPPDLPQVLLEQLKPGGKLIAPVGRGVFDQYLRLWTKRVDGKVEMRNIIPVRFVPMVNDKPGNNNELY